MRSICAALCGLFTLVAACSASHSPDDDAGTVNCVPGTSRTCEVPSCCFSGTQLCATDGRSYGECRAPCGMPCDAGPPPDVGAPDSGPAPDAAAVRDAGAPDAHVSAACSLGGGCDLRGHDCPLGQGCLLTDTASVCGPAGPGRAGDPCTTMSDCAGGTVCIGSVPTRSCRSVACAPTDCAPGDVYTHLARSDGTPFANGIGFCAPEGGCTPVPDSGCPAGQQCDIAGPSGTTACRPLGTVTEGGACGGATCASGLVCAMTSSGAPTCHRVCRLGVSADCPTGMCGPISGTIYGICI